MTRGETLGETIRMSKTAMLRYLKGFSDDNHTRQADHLPNHVAWTLGHLAAYMHKASEKLDGQPTPTGDFIPGGATGDKTRYGGEGLGFGSQPVADPSIYPTCARCVQIFESACDRCAAAFAAADDAKLDSETEWGKTTLQLRTLAGRMVFHNGTHCGQIADLRRALGMGSILG